MKPFETPIQPAVEQGSGMLDNEALRGALEREGQAFDFSFSWVVLPPELQATLDRMKKITSVPRTPAIKARTPKRRVVKPQLSDEMIQRCPHCNGDLLNR